MILLFKFPIELCNKIIKQFIVYLSLEILTVCIKLIKKGIHFINNKYIN